MQKSLKLSYKFWEWSCREHQETPLLCCFTTLNVMQKEMLTCHHMWDKWWEFATVGIYFIVRWNAAFYVSNLLFLSKSMTFFSRREWAVTVFWAPQLCLMLAGCVKETTPPARSTKDCTASSIILTVSQRGWLELVGWFYWLWWVYLKACKRFVYPFIPSFLSCLLSVYSSYTAPIYLFFIYDCDFFAF